MLAWFGELNAGERRTMGACFGGWAFAGDQRTGSKTQNQPLEDIKGTPADPDRLAVNQKLAAMRQDPETAELDDRRRLGHRIHRGNYSGRVRKL